MKQARGFTLIELLVVIAIIGVLAAIAVPQYSDYVTRSKLADAHSNLSTLRIRAEQWFQDNRAYNFGDALPAVCAAVSNASFTYSCPTAAITATTYTITATGNATAGLSGIAFTINEANARATAITAGSAMATAGYTAAACWVRAKGGVC